MLVLRRHADAHAIEPEAERCRDGDRGKSRLYAAPSVHGVGKTSEPRISSYCPEKSKAGCGGWCSESAPTTTGVLAGVPTGVLMEGCEVASAPAKVFS